MDERERLSEIMKSQGLNAKQFSEVLGVSAGSISNIMGGRNKPSHDFLKIVATTFPFISRSWLFMDEGEMFKPGCEASKKSEELDLFSAIETNIDSRKNQPLLQRAAIDQSSAKLPNTPAISQPKSQRAVQKIVIFYTDGTFEER